MPSPPPATHPLVGAELAGTYRVMGVLGTGGMGTVFLAYHLRLHCRVAIKMLDASLSGHREFVERFDREAKLVAELRHPHIVSVLDYGVTPDGQPFLVMELLEGRTLQSRIADTLLSVVDVARIASEIAGALVHAHAAGVVHRDLKPSNVYLIDAAGHPDFVKLLDFGISRRLGLPRRSQTRVVQGTPAYMAPEQIADPGAVDERADQYALGTIVYEMLAGAPPFAGDNVAELMDRIVHAPAPPLRLVRAFLPSAVDEVLARALSKDPADRFADVCELAYAVGQALEVDLTLYTGDYPAPAIVSPPPSRDRPGRRLESTLSERTPPPDLLGSVLHDLCEAKRLLAVGAASMACELCEDAWTIAEERRDDPTLSLLEVAEDLAVRVFRAVAGEDSATLAATPLARRQHLSPAEAYLLSRIDPPLTLAELLDVSGLAQLETLRMLVRLIKRGAAVSTPATPA